MLSRSIPLYRKSSLRGSQRGVVLVIALIVLVVMTLAGIALVRSVDTSNIIAGNLAFQQSATHAGDRAIESAIAWLEDCVGARVFCTANPPFNDDAAVGYFAAGTSITNPRTPAAGQSWDDYWKANIQTLLFNNSVTLAADAGTTGNTSYYIIDRLCQNAGPPTGGASCAKSPQLFTNEGQGEESGEPPLQLPSLVYYRITVRTVGPRNTVSYIQALVAM